LRDSDGVSPVIVGEWAVARVARFQAAGAATDVIPVPFRKHERLRLLARSRGTFPFRAT
jgi:hypothetical protein